MTERHSGAAECKPVCFSWASVLPAFFWVCADVLKQVCFFWRHDAGVVRPDPRRGLYRAGDPWRPLFAARMVPSSQCFFLGVLRGRPPLRRGVLSRALAAESGGRTFSPLKILKSKVIMIFLM